MTTPPDALNPEPGGPSPSPGAVHPHLPMLEVPDAPSPAVSDAAIIIGATTAIGIVLLLHWFCQSIAAVAPRHVPVWTTIPFALLLLALSGLPFLAARFWERYYSLICIGLGGLVAAYYVVHLHADGEILANLEQYVQFLTLVGGLFIISGGLAVRMQATATPATNVLFLLCGAILANVLGTTGAGILLIRPWLHLNRQRTRSYHVVFFIFIVANIGGILSPLGDPPLLLGYIAGVPFWWYALHCWPAWLVGTGMLLAMFYLLDRHYFHTTSAELAQSATAATGFQLQVLGRFNLLLLGLLIAGVTLPAPWRELAVIACAAISLKATPAIVHQHNRFSFAPIKEIGYIFLGLFLTMTPALNVLANQAAVGNLGRQLRTPGEYYFLTGGLSSVLDNAPTFLAALNTRLGQLRGRDATMAVPPPKSARWPALPQSLATSSQASRPITIGPWLGDPRFDPYLLAMTLGAVLFGAATYIGNAPNFMIRSIAQHHGVRCPGFLAYLVVFAIPLLLPVLVVVWLLFL